LSTFIAKNLFTKNYTEYTQKLSMLINTIGM
jgi:hypothetical protein